MLYRVVTIDILINLNKFSTQQKTKKWKLKILENGHQAALNSTTTGFTSLWWPSDPASSF